VSDNFSAAEQAVRHLIEHGRRRILCLGGDPVLCTIQDRVKGATRAMTESGLDVLVEMDTVDYKSADAAIMKHMGSRKKIDAIFGMYNQSAIYAYEVMQNRNIRTPEAVSLIGFDDFVLAATLRPSITVVRQPIEELARSATQLLLDHMAGKVTSSQQIEIASKLVIRQSCGCNRSR
jgi:LacI family transcriptional regulator